MIRRLLLVTCQSQINYCVGVLSPQLFSDVCGVSVMSLTQTFYINLRNKLLCITGCTSHIVFSLFTFNYAFIMLLYNITIFLGLFHI